MGFESEAFEPERPREINKSKLLIVLAGVIIVGGMLVALLGGYGILAVNPGMVAGFSFLVASIMVCCAAVMVTGSVASRLPEYSEMEDKFRLGMHYYDSEEWDEALKIFQELIGPNRDHKRALYYAARCYEKMDNWEQVKYTIRRYLELQPNDREAWELLATAHKRLFEYEEAEEAQRRAEDLQPRGE